MKRLIVEKFKRCKMQQHEDGLFFNLHDNFESIIVCFIFVCPYRSFLEA